MPRPHSTGVWSTLWFPGAPHLPRRGAGPGSSPVDPAFALELCKSVINAAGDLDEDQLVQKSLTASDRVFSSPECREGVRAFFAKTTPDFRIQEHS